MPFEASEARGTIVAHGWGLKLYVERGHLIVHDGVGRQRRTQRFSRATSKLKRIVVIGHGGFVTLEALRWIRDVGAVFVQIGADAELITLTAPARHHESKLRRAQVAAVETGVGHAAIAALLAIKLDRQADIAEQYAHLKPSIGKGQRRITVAEAIRAQLPALAASETVQQLRLAESIAGRAYWQLLARTPIRFDKSSMARIPEHWQIAGPRTSYVDKKRARLAQTPVHAVLNYLYAVLETEATIAAHAVGLDPALGILHTDIRYRSSLATDLMEPARPVADRIALDLLHDRELQRGDVHETRRGVCRLGPDLAARLAGAWPDLRAAVAPHAEQLAQSLLKKTDHATPLTRRRHAAALAGSAATGD